MGYFRCLDCGRVTKADYGEWPTCKCKNGKYSGELWTDFEGISEEQYWDLLEEE